MQMVRDCALGIETAVPLYCSSLGVKVKQLTTGDAGMRRERHTSMRASVSVAQVTI